MKDGGPAFPQTVYSSHPNTGYCGLTLRDYFAAEALQGLLVATQGEDYDRIGDLPSYAYQIADAMLAEREKP